MKYPDEWQGAIPQSLLDVKAGRGLVTVQAFHSLAWIEHYSFPVWKPFEQLRVHDVACGTGEGILVSALSHSGAQYVLDDPEPESLAQTREYAAQLELPNVKFSGEPGETGAPADILFCSRPLNQLSEAPAMLRAGLAKLAPGGIMELQCDTDPSVNGVKAARERINRRIEEEKMSLVEAAWQELQDEAAPGGWTVPFLQEQIEAAGWKVLEFLHPQMYDPRSYLPEGGEAMEEKLRETSRQDKARLAEILAGGIRRHTALCLPQAERRRIPQMADEDARALIPFRSPYADVRRENGQIFFQAERWALPVNDAVPMGEVCAPEAMGAVFAAIDGKKNFEQLHRRFLPMSWDVFWHFMTLLAENGLLYLHREAK